MTENTTSDVEDDVTKLNLANFKGKLYGRSKDLSDLLQAYHRVLTSSLDKDEEDGIGAKDNDEPYCQSPSEMVLVSGSSGVGKSALVEKLKEECDASNNSSSNCYHRHYFVSGKFNQLNNDSRPYSAVSSALNDLCSAILNSSSEHTRLTKGVANAIRNSLGSEGLQTLAPNVPKLHKVVGQCIGETAEQGGDRKTEKMTASVACAEPIKKHENNNFLRARDGFLFCLVALVRAVCSNCNILVLFLDDLQWADPESIRLIRALLTDTQIRNLLFVGAYRNDEVIIENRPSIAEKKSRHFSDIDLAGCLYDVEMKNCIKITRINLENLDKESVNLLISDVLHQDEEDTISLTQTVFRKTQGNIFFVLQFLESLHYEKLLQFSFLSYKWTWASDDEIQSTMDVSDNVADLMVKKIQRLQRESQFVLMISSCLGFHFDEDLVKYIIGSWQQNLNESIVSSHRSDELHWEEIRAANDSFQVPKNIDVTALLATAVKDGFLDKVIELKKSIAVYKFSHDRVQQAIFSLLSSRKEVRVLHLNIGELLLRRWSALDDIAQEEKQWLLFITVNQLNEGSDFIDDTDKCIELVQLNIQASEAAAISSAFVPASAYLEKALTLLKKSNPWVQHYNLMLKVCTLLASMKRCTGNLESCLYMTKIVMMNAKSLQDKIEVYTIHMDASLSKGDNLKNVIRFGFRILSELGEKFPRKAHVFAVQRTFSKTRKTLNKMSDTDLLALPDVRNEEKSAAMKILGYLFGCCALIQSRHFFLIVFRLVQLSIDYGICESSASAFAMYGAILCRSVHHTKSGVRLMPIALAMQKRVGNECHSLAIYIVHELLNIWNEHIQMSLDPLLKMYKAGVHSGNMLTALMCAEAYCEMYVYSGMPLPPIEKDMRLYHQLMVEYGQSTALRLLLPLWQFVLNLLGKSENPLELKGEAMDLSLFMGDAMQNGSSVAALSGCCLQLELAYLFGDLKLATETMATVYKHPIGSHLVSLRQCRFVCFSGLVALAMARQIQQTCLDKLCFNTQRRRWLKQWLRDRRRVKAWVECNAGNLLHLLLLMDAEHDSLNENDKDVKKSFDAAISIAGRHGFLHDQALANERAGIFFLEKSDEFWASYYLSRSHELYKEYGAHAKVYYMQEKYSPLLELSDDREKLKGHRGISRFSDVAKNHKTINIVGLYQRQNSQRSNSASSGQSISLSTSNGDEGG